MPIDTIIPNYRVVYTFPDKKTRTAFCEGKYLEMIGSREDFMDSNLDLHIHVEGQVKSRIKACNAAAELHGADIHHTCGGSCVDDCSKFQNSFGKSCNYCEYVESRMLS
jgi:hypothetical protein